MSLANYLGLLIGDKRKRDEFFLDPGDHPIKHGVSEEGRAVLFSMNPQLIAFYVLRIEGVDLTDEIFNYYESMESKWPYMGLPHEEPWKGGAPGPFGPAFLSSAAWSYPTPQIWKLWPATHKLSDGLVVPIKLSGEGFLPGAEVRFDSATQHFSCTAALADWDKKSFRVTHIKASINLNGAAPDLFQVTVRNLNWLQPLKWGTGLFDLKA